MSNIFFLKGNVFFLTLLYLAITVYNVVFLDSPMGLVLTAIQYALVVYFLVKNDIQMAFFLHVIFTVSCVNGGLIIIDHSFSYAKVKLVGPFTLNYIMLGILWLNTLRFKVKVESNSLLMKFRKMILYFIIVGTLVGLIGFVLDSDYKFKYLIDSLLYVIVAFLYVDVFTKLYTEQYSKQFAISTICMLAASSISTVVTYYLFGVSAEYSVEESFINNPIYFMTPCLIIGLFQMRDMKLKIVAALAIVFYVASAIIMSRGATYLTMFVAILLLIYLVYFKKSDNKSLRRLKIALPILLVLGIPVILNVILSSGEISGNKFKQFISLFSLLEFDESFANRLALIGRSPYIRIAQIIEIFHEELDNIIFLIIGKGYGSYYTDSLNLFNGIDLSLGVFPDDMINSGKFYKAHNVISCTLLYNGLVGLFYMFKLGFSYLVHIDKTFLVFAGFSLFLYGFYFDTVALVSCSMALFGAEYMLYKKGEKESIC